MSVAPVYPTEHPPRSCYLPSNPRKVSFTVFDAIIDQYLGLCAHKIEHYKKTDARIPKHIAADFVYRLIEQLSENVRQHRDLFPTTLPDFKPLVDHLVGRLEAFPKPRAVYESLLSLFLEFLALQVLKNPFATRKPPFALLEEDFQIARALYAPYVQAKRTAACFDFAFYHLNETNAFPFIFHVEEGKWPVEFEKNPIDYLNRWGYDLVDLPLPGDLVIYCGAAPKEYGNLMVVQHSGLWTQNDMVISKLGSHLEVFKLPLQDMPITYGHFAYFFRKKIPSFVLKEFVNLTHFLQHHLGNFSHECTRSPLSTLGTVRKIHGYLVQMEIRGVFKRSLYNIEYNLALKAKFLKLVHYALELSPRYSKAEMFADLRERAIRVSHEMRIEI